MEKEEILDAIRRCAEQNGGVAPGRQRFEKLTGIREHDWAGRYWVRWSEAVAEAGFQAGSMNAALPDDAILDALADFVRELGHFPVNAELRLRRRSDPAFPTHNVFARLGSKAELARRLMEHVQGDPAFAGVAELCEPIAVAGDTPPDDEDLDHPVAGQVYLMKSGAYYKLGRSNAAGRRAYELAIQLPEKLEVVHVIDTDDAVGIERYWHQRFADRRANGEWFALTAADVAAFRRRKKFM